MKAYCKYVRVGNSKELPTRRHSSLKMACNAEAGPTHTSAIGKRKMVPLVDSTMATKSAQVDEEVKVAVVVVEDLVAVKAAEARPTRSRWQEMHTL